VADFSRIVWSDRGFRLGDLHFRTQTYLEDIERAEAVDGRHFVIYKNAALIDQFAAFWAGAPDFLPRRILELGVWSGGSTVLWAELVRPDKLVAVDVAPQDRMGEDHLANLRGYLRDRKLETRVKFHWGVDQTDGPALRDIVRSELGGVIDHVIDDASHAYSHTKRAFELLFPLIRAGGWYAIEDWSWDLALGLDAPEEMRSAPPLSPLVLELVRLAGADPGIVRRVRVEQGIAFVERGAAPLDEGFTIDSRMPRRS
jgi:predicted O-methyltransferase YrrM